jgi:hypothetical protein
LDATDCALLALVGKPWQGGIENKHSTDVESPPPPRVCTHMSGVGMGMGMSGVGTENKHSTDAESPAPLRICMRGRIIENEPVDRR